MSDESSGRKRALSPDHYRRKHCRSADEIHYLTPRRMEHDVSAASAIERLRELHQHWAFTAQEAEIARAFPALLKCAEALEKCEAQFRWYADNHRTKGTPATSPNQPQLGEETG